MSFHKIRGSHEARCPAAVLQTMLLKLEVSMFGNDEHERDEQKELYLRYLHENLGRVNPAWPLQEGWRRVTELEEELEKKTSYRISMIMNMCSVKDRFGEVHGLDWLTNKSALLQKDPDLLKQVHVWIYIVDLPKCTATREDLKEIEAVVGNLTIERYTGAPEREEQSSYFRHIVDNYDDLADFIIFTHPDAPEHLGAEMKPLLAALNLLKTNTEYVGVVFLFIFLFGNGMGG